MIRYGINPVEIPGPTFETFCTKSWFSACAVKDFKCSFEARWVEALPSLPWLMPTSWVASMPQGMKTGRRKIVSHKSPDFCNWNLRVKFGRLKRAEQEETFTKRCEKNHNKPKHAHFQKNSLLCKTLLNISDYLHSWVWSLVSDI